MAPPGDPPEAAPPDIYYKCHPQTKCCTVYCILCDSVFHKSDFIRHKDVKFITRVLVVCNLHSDIELTSNSDNAKVVLSYLKDQSEKRNKEFEILKQENTQLKTETQELTKTNETQQEFGNVSGSMDLDTTMHENSLILSVKSENNVLKELNTELKSKNLLLEELLKKERESSNNTMSYSQITALQTNKHTLFQPKIVPRLIITKKDSKDASDVKQNILLQKAEEKKAKVSKIINKGDDSVIISCLSTESSNIVEKCLRSNLDQYNIVTESTKNPVVRITGINNITDMCSEELKLDINDRNFENYQDKVKILNTTKKDTRGYISLICEVSASIHKTIKENRDRLFVGHQRCKVFDVISTRPCYNCGMLNHSGRKCENEATCLRCAGSHSTNNCKKKKEVCCINCLYSNNTYDTTYEVNHMTTDSSLCPILKSKIKKFIQNTNYIVKPTIPKHMGKIHNFNKERHVNSAIYHEKVTKI